MPVRHLSRTPVLLLAVVCGVTTANVYYAQPILDLIARTLGSSEAAASNLITAGQIGTAVGLLFLVPAADIVRRRPVLISLFALDAVALAAMAVVPNVTALAGLSMLVGLASVANPIILAYTATLAGDEQRGKVLGTVMSGILLGILLSRTVSSLIAEAGGWRAVYVVAAVAMIAVTVAVAFALPDERAGSDVSYRRQLLAVLTQFREHPTLRSRCLIGACVMATFTGFWTTVAFLLSRPPFSFGQIGIGLFALSGVAGALTTSFGGGLIDRHRDRRWQFTGVSLAALVLSFVILAAGGSSLWLLLVGAVVMDAAMQALHVTNQSVVYELDETARARLASGYMTSFAIGAAAGSIAFAAAYQRFGWVGTCFVGVGFAVLASVVWMFGSSAERTASCAVGEQHAVADLPDRDVSAADAAGSRAGRR